MLENSANIDAPKYTEAFAEIRAKLTGAGYSVYLVRINTQQCGIRPHRQRLLLTKTAADDNCRTDSECSGLLLTMVGRNN